MGEIKTDLFPEVLRMKAGREYAKKNDRGDTQSNAVIPVETIAESIRKRKEGQEKE